MKLNISIKNVACLLSLSIILLTFVACNRGNDFEADDFPQEEITNIILKITDEATSMTQSYNYSVGSDIAPSLKLEDGKTYSVNAQFMNGSEDVTGEIDLAKDEHFLIFDFPRSTINLERLDLPNNNGKKVGLKTRWTVVKAVKDSSPKLILTLIHDPQSVNEALNGTAWGSVVGGETDSEATYGITN